MSEGFTFNHQFRFIWHTTWDEPCEKCQRLNGREYTSQSLYQHVLWDTIEGDLWDLDNDMPLTHPNCKCVLEVLYESTLEELLKIPELGESDPYKEFQIMTSNIKEMRAEIKEFERDLSRANRRIDNNRAQLTAYLLLLQKAGLPPQAEKAISILLRVKMTSEQAARALYLLMAASGPAGWGMALATIGVSVIGAYGVVESTRDLVMDIGGT